ncbi:MAG: DUF6089 family protein [Salinivirgaceae bacterium]|nr:DUF6089 family protein [Salinivirgaceae bacterium]
MIIGRREVLSIILTLVFGCACAQTHSVRYGELGGALGVQYYLGDINPIPFKSSRPVGELFYRMNFNTRFATKGLFSFGSLAADDSKYKSKFQKERGESFSTSIARIAAMGEFNFIPYMPGPRNKNYTPYIQAGLGAFVQTKAKGDRLIFDVPFGVGMKFTQYKRITYGFDWTMHLLLSDNIDFSSSSPSHVTVIKQKNVNSDRDWMSYLGFYLAYRVEYPPKCPSFD